MNTIKLTYGLEEIKSRIPGLFPYIEFDENHAYTLHSASDSSSGCYGKIPCSLTVPSNDGLNVDGVQIIKGGCTYSYNTLMECYRKYRDLGGNFIKFMERGIGRFKIDAPGLDWDKCILVPEYEYYANSARLYDEYVKMKATCTAYQGIEDENCDLMCVCTKYEQMGGDIMLNFYKTKAVEAETIAAEYYGYRSDTSALAFDINIVSSSNDLGILNTFLNFFDPTETYHKGDEVIYNDRTYVCNLEEREPGPWKDSDFMLMSCGDRTVPGTDISAFQGKTNSKLSTFRNNANYIDAGGNISKPDDGVDWLWYYHIGDVGFHETTTDEHNNIQLIDDSQSRIETVNHYDSNLLAYGDVITEITRDPNARTITFTYVIGAHLKARFKEAERDDDGNYIYKYDQFEWDKDDKGHGVRYTETYTYEKDGEIDELDSSQFTEYVTTIKRASGLRYYKCEFDTSSLSTVSEVDINGIPTEVGYIISDYTVDYNTELDILCSSTTKMDYMTGLPYKPTVVNDVRVNRGNAAAWERHMRLGELQTFEDLENYHNGGFFILR